MGISIPAATDYLVALAVSTTTGLIVGGEPVYTWDGWPLNNSSQGSLVIGLSEPPTVDDSGETPSTGQRTWLTMGVNNTMENYTIPCYVLVWTGSSDQMSQTRLDAASIFDAFAHGINVDPTLGGAVMQAQIVDISLAPTATGSSAQQGRRTVISFGVKCMNVYEP